MADVRLSIVNQYGAPTVGLTKMGWVRVELSSDGPRCEVVGTYRRRVVVRRVPLATATALMARGVPSVVRQPRHPEGHRPVPAHT